MGSVLRHDVKYRPSYHDDSDDGNDDVDTTVLLQVNPTLLYSTLLYSTLQYSILSYLAYQ
jgi:hypothetical protein